MSAPRRALVVIDVQNDYFDGPLEIRYPPREDSLARIGSAMDVAAEHGLPVVVVRHELPEGAPVFAAGSAGQALHPDVEKRTTDAHKRVTKSRASVFAGTDVASWLADKQVDCITLVGYMTNNCVIGTAAAAEDLGIAVEVLSDATGAIDIVNDAGSASARQVHETLMALLNSNFAAVATTAAWTGAVEQGQVLAGSDLGTSAVQGRATYDATA
ncbi:isochorismatase family protein [Blastococcus saxobsidens]|uniref:Nicotinamidase-related amidase n=1 Tax=Blastococcus saxobsidens TaxID=138336 RepID=A0A4Q7Y5U2_9ACTN|nr:isochorismatase family protein [Blastococcus saxobsidens]RZU31804.1 nicotinamidase-related amidase [Blastococcus saxobsidens]